MIKIAKITKDMMIMEAVQKYPKTAEVLMNSGLHCIGCIAAHGETLQQGLEAHGFDTEKIDKVIKDMNDAVKEED